MNSLLQLLKTAPIPEDLKRQILEADNSDKEIHIQIIEDCIAMYYDDLTNTYRKMAEFLYDMGLGKRH